MIHRRLIIALLAVSLCTVASAHDYLTSITSQVYQTQGTPREIATRASTCISQHLAGGTVNAPVIVSSDLDQGVIVAHSALQYPDGMLDWQVRSVFTFEARDGRFRIEQTSLERFNDMGGGWGPIGEWTGSGWKKAEAAFTASADAVAQCVMTPTRKDDW